MWTRWQAAHDEVLAAYGWWLLCAGGPGVGVAGQGALGARATLTLCGAAVAVGVVVVVPSAVPVA